MRAGPCARLSFCLDGVLDLVYAARMKTIGKAIGAVVGAIGIIVGILLLLALWLAYAVAGLAVPGLALWALGHFAFGWW